MNSDSVRCVPFSVHVCIQADDRLASTMPFDPSSEALWTQMF